MKTLICLLTLGFTSTSFAIETKLEGSYEINVRSEKCASAFEISVQNECLVLEYGAAAAREFCRINKAPKVTKRVVDIEKEKFVEYTTVVETLFADVLTVSETVALKNKYGITVKRTNSMATYAAKKEGLSHKEAVSEMAAMQAPKYIKRSCQYKTL